MAESTSASAARASELDRDDEPGLAEAAAELPLAVRAHLVTMVLYGVGLAVVLFVLLFPRFVLFFAVLAAGAWGYVKLYGVVERKMAESEGLPARNAPRPASFTARSTGRARRSGGRKASRKTSGKTSGSPAKAVDAEAAADGGRPDGTLDREP